MSHAMIGFCITSISAVAFFLSDHHLNAPNTWNNADESLEAGLLFRVRHGRAQRRIAFLLLALLAGIVMIHARVKVSLMPVSSINRTGAGWIIWTLISVFWSRDRSLSLRRLLPWLATFSCGFALGFTAGLSETVVAVAFVCSLFLAIGVANEVKQASFFRRRNYRFAGTLHPNQQALNCTILAGSVGYLMKLGFLSTLFGGILLIFAVIGLTLTGSRSGVWAALVAAVTHTAFGQMRNPNWASLVQNVEVLFLLAAASAIAHKALAGLSTSRGGTLPFDRLLEFHDYKSDKITLTGRLLLWKELLSDIRRRLFVGEGFGAFWDEAKILSIRRRTGWRFADSHSIYLETITGTGMIGLSLLLLLIFVDFKSVLSMKQHYESFLPSFLVLVVVQGAFESTFVQPGFAAAVAAAVVGASSR